MRTLNVQREEHRTQQDRCELLRKQIAQNLEQIDSQLAGARDTQAGEQKTNEEMNKQTAAMSDALYEKRETLDALREETQNLRVTLAACERVHPEAFKLYISARSDVEFGGKIVFKRTWFRLVRRTVRDYNFRGSDPAETMSMWANVRRGEKNNISPFKDKANFQFDTSLPYELAVFNRTATELFRSVPEGIERFDELRQVLPALQLFGDIDEKYVAKESLIREFIGGGIYEY